MKTITMRNITCTAVILLFVFACNTSEKLPNYGVDTSMQGIKGMVELTDTDKNTQQGVQREVYIFELANSTQAESVGNLYKNIQSRLVRRVMTSMNGSFVIALPSGTYSVLVSHDGGYYADEKDNAGNINPIVVENNQFTNVKVNINPALTY